MTPRSAALDLSPARRVGFRRRLLEWYARNARDLPWRRTRDPYAIWVAEIILQQTRVDQGMPYFERFMATFPTVESLAVADEDAVLKTWEGLGYYGRARNLLRAARAVVHERNGRLPQTRDEWLMLPGIGRYTAGAIASIAQGEPAPILDGNVIRVLTRVFNIEASADDPATRSTLWSIAESLTPRIEPGQFNQALMELGACVCAPRAPRCGECPVRRQCLARVAGTQEHRPVRPARSDLPHREFVVAAITRGGRYLMGKRPGNGLLAGLWEFPSESLESGDCHETGLERLGRANLGVDIRVGDCLGMVKHTYTHFRSTNNLYRCVIVEGKPRPLSHVQLKWVRRTEFAQLPIPKANQKFLSMI